MTNANYPIRPVRPAEIIAACGTAAIALRVTGGCEKLALFYLHNREKAKTAGEVNERETDLRDFLKAAAVADEWRERTNAAATAYNLAGTLSSIMDAVHCGHPLARRLLDSAKARRLIREPQPKPRTKKCATPPATKPADAPTT